MAVPKENEFQLKESDIEFRFSKGEGKGGQHMQKTESVVYAKHKPSGIEVKSGSERSQHHNKTIALEMLKSKLFEDQQSKNEGASNQSRKKQIGSGMRGDKIRTIRTQEGIVKCDVTGKTTSWASYQKGNIEF